MSQDKLVAARMKDGLLSWGIVYFRFFTSQKKYATECTTRFSCPFCRMSMGAFTVSRLTFKSDQILTATAHPYIANASCTLLIGSWAYQACLDKLLRRIESGFVGQNDF